MLFLKAFQCFLNGIFTPSHNFSNFVRSFGTTLFSPARSRRNRHPPQQNITQRDGMLACEGRGCFGYQMFRMLAEWQSLLVGTCCHVCNGLGPGAMPFSDSSRRRFRDSGNASNLLRPLMQRCFQTVARAQSNLYFCRAAAINSDLACTQAG